MSGLPGRNAMFAGMLGIVTAFGLAGCASTGYWSDRGRAAMDVVTLTVGYGIGAKGRVGPVETGLGFFVEGPGVRGGDFIWGMKDYWHEGSDEPQGVEGQLVVVGLEKFEGGKTAMARGKSLACKTIAFWKIPVDAMKQSDSDAFRETLKERGYVYNPWPMYTEVEAVAALGPAVRVGVNPGELVDFILGWTTLDIYSDDLSRKQDGGPKDHSAMK